MTVHELDIGTDVSDVNVVETYNNNFEDTDNNTIVESDSDSSIGSDGHNLRDASDNTVRAS